MRPQWQAGGHGPSLPPCGTRLVAECRGYCKRCRKPTGNDHLEKRPQCPCAVPLVWKLDRFRRLQRSRESPKAGDSPASDRLSRWARTADPTVFAYTYILVQLLSRIKESCRPATSPLETDFNQQIATPALPSRRFRPGAELRAHRNAVCGRHGTASCQSPSTRRYRHVICRSVRRCLRLPPRL
jgi:hypothetical protein